jgi:hypothetical protein
MAKPKLALIPAAQGTKFYSVLPSDGVGDFTFARGSVATRINAQGLIENVASGVSRLNYPMIDGVQKGCPHHILEPTRTQLVQYSEDFSQSYWSKVRSTITSNQIISPDGTLNADLLTATDTSENYCQQNVSSTVSGSKQTASFFVKKGTSNFCHILLWDVSNDGARQWFDLTNGFKGSSTSFGSGISVDSSQMINYGNGWYKCIVVFNNSNTTVRIRISASNYDGSTTSSIGKTIYIYGAQLEVGSFPTSYIPNNGNAAGVTRSTETATGAGNASTFNDSEGVLMAEISALDLSNYLRELSISDGTISNRIQLRYYDTSDNKIQSLVVVGGSTQASALITLSNAKEFNKIAFKYKLNDFALWVNGLEVFTDTSGSTFSANTLSELSFDKGDGGNPFYGNTKQIQYFDSALNDSELEQLTSWTSFTDMANGQLYTIE